MLDSSSASLLGRLKAKAVPMDDLGLAPMSINRIAMYSLESFIYSLTVLPKMPLFFPAHD